MARRACLTHEKLQRRGFEIASWCSLRNETNETNSHLFLHCKVTAQLWAIFLSRTHTNWTMPEHTADLLNCWVRTEKRGEQEPEEMVEHDTLLYMVDYLERKKQEVYGKSCRISTKDQMVLYKDLLFLV